MAASAILAACSKKPEESPSVGTPVNIVCDAIGDSTKKICSRADDKKSLKSPKRAQVSRELGLCMLANPREKFDYQYENDEGTMLTIETLRAGSRIKASLEIEPDGDRSLLIQWGDTLATDGGLDGNLNFGWDHGNDKKFLDEGGVKRDIGNKGYFESPYDLYLGVMSEHCKLKTSSEERIDKLDISKLEVEEIARLFAGDEKLHLFGQPVLSSNPKASTLILVEDKSHAAYDAKLKQLERLAARYGLNHFWVEGWAGEAADKERGQKILSGDIKMLKILFEKSAKGEVSLEPLEEAKIQEAALKMMALYYYKLRKVTGNADGLRKIDFILNGLRTETGIDINDDNFQIISEEVHSVFAYKMGTDPGFLQQDREAMRTLNSQKRSQVAAAKIKDVLAKKPREIIVAVMGAAHSEDMLKIINPDAEPDHNVIRLRSPFGLD